MRLFLLSAALGAVLSLGVANAEVLAVCGKAEALSPVSFGSQGAWQAGEEAVPQALGKVNQIALLRDSAGFDVALNWGERSQVSLRAEGAQIMGNELGLDLIHLIVARTNSHSLEHFLFSFEDDSRGELIWSASGDGDEAHDGIVSYDVSCTRPK